ncbi:MAG: ABC transporter permease, partial [Actinomycetes bacterium]|nr:ABC transporter permease [Actinomycetes bacterium]
MKRIWLVTVREVRAALAKRAFVIATALMLVLIVAGSFVVDYFVNQEMEDAASQQLGLTSELADMEPALAAAGEALGVDIETSTVVDRAAAETALEADEIDAFLSGEPGDLDLLFESGANQSIVQAVTSAAQTTALSDQITALGGEPAAVAAAVQSSSPTLSFIEDPAAMEGPQYFIAVVMVALLFFALVNSGSQIAIGVVEEKASRVVEILLATLRPTELFAGKVLGNGIVGLMQVVLYAAAFGVAASVTGMFEGFEINL